MMKKPKASEIMGVKIDSTRTEGVLVLASDWVAKKSKIKNEKSKLRSLFVVTAYSETVLEAQESPEFKRAIDRADLVVADGVGVAAAVDYIDKFSIFNFQFSIARLVYSLWLGLGAGWGILTARYAGRTVPGVGLMEKLVGAAAEKGWKVVVLGGWRGVSAKAAEKLKIKYQKAKMQSKEQKFEMIPIDGPANISEMSEAENRELVGMINKYQPDLLFVSFGRFRQEIWIAKNLDKLNAGVVMGVGSAFDEIAGTRGSRVPGWVTRMGLKTPWRLFAGYIDIKRVWRAVVVFPWRVWRDQVI